MGTVEYQKNEDGSVTPLRVHTIVISTQHDPDYKLEDIQADLKEHVIKPIVPAKYLDAETIYHLNPSGSFVVGGPEGGGGAFSGKDPTKVDRSAAYYCRWIAKSLVAAGLCHRCLVQLSYAIGVAEPLSIFVDTYGSARHGLSDGEILDVIKSNFDCRAGMLVIELDLKKPKYHKTAAYGHFGNCARKEDPDFTWETPKALTMTEPAKKKVKA